MLSCSGEMVMMCWQTHACRQHVQTHKMQSVRKGGSAVGDRQTWELSNILLSSFIMVTANFLVNHILLLFPGIPCLDAVRTVGWRWDGVYGRAFLAGRVRGMRRVRYAATWLASIVVKLHQAEDHIRWDKFKLVVWICNHISAKEQENSNNDLCQLLQCFKVDLANK